MKKYAILALTLVLAATMFTGCRRRNTDTTSEPTLLPTVPMTDGRTDPSTMDTTPETTPTVTRPTDNGPTGAATDTTGAATDTTGIPGDTGETATMPGSRSRGRKPY